VAYRRTPGVQARLDAQRAAILGAASSLLAERGYAACTVANVAARAGISAGSMYTHFPAKSDLVAELFRSVVGHEVDVVRAAVHNSSTAADAIAVVVATFVGRALKSPRRAYALLAEPVDPAVEQLRLEFRHAYRDVVADAIRRGVSSGELPPQNADIVAAALVGAIGEAMVGPLAAQSPDPETVPTLTQFAHRAIGGHVRAHA
jgi:AcrR family transcriptional regulator